MGCPKHPRLGVCYKLKSRFGVIFAGCAPDVQPCVPAQLANVCRNWTELFVVLLKRPHSIDKFWIHLFLFQSVELHAKHLAIFWLQWYFWKFETRIGLDSLHSGPKHFARHRIWTFLTLILIPLAILSISHIFYHLTNTWWKTSRALQPNSFWCFKKKSFRGVSTSLHSLTFFAA